MGREKTGSSSWERISVKGWKGWAVVTDELVQRGLTTDPPAGTEAATDQP